MGRIPTGAGGGGGRPRALVGGCRARSEGVCPVGWRGGWGGKQRALIGGCRARSEGELQWCPSPTPQGTLQKTPSKNAQVAKFPSLDPALTPYPPTPLEPRIFGLPPPPGQLQWVSPPTLPGTQRRCSSFEPKPLDPPLTPCPLFGPTPEPKPSTPKQQK